ncbi:ankyrin repeat protein [Legionella busanensis]|uniref:Ankyrin repeat protein n=1 Tax=Legionella busanensis TaxID=190655 RepID=A0A378JSH5_9GAMM|nr:ankyrin repeat protein [Legionella busanensis]
MLWVGDKNLEENEKKLNGLIDNNRDNVNFVVITSPEHMDEAIALFGQERVFTAKQMKGLQAKTVLLYRFFEQENFRAANKDLDKNLELQDNTTISKDSRGSIRHNNIFNELFVACTRAESDLIIYQPPVHSIQACISPLEKWVLTCLAPPASSNQEHVISTREEWLEQAQIYRKNGQIDQAEAIEARFAMPLNSTIADPGQTIAVVAPELKPELNVVSTAKKPKKKKQVKVAKAPLSAEEQLDVLLDKMINKGQVSALEQFFKFPFQKLKDYQKLTPYQQTAQNVAAKILIDYLQTKNISLGHLPETMLSLLESNFIKMSKWQKPNKNQREFQDDFISLICYQPASGMSLADVIKKNYPKGFVQGFIDSFKEKRFAELFVALEEESNINIVFNLKRLELLHTLNPAGCTLLHLAVSEKHLEKVIALIAAGININQTNNHGQTALHVAAVRGFKESFFPLITNGADVNCVTHSGLTPLMFAVEHEHIEAAAILIAASANVNLMDKLGRTALYFAANNGCLQIVFALLDQGADVNQARNNSETPLFAAALTGNFDIVDILLKVKNCEIKACEMKIIDLLREAKEDCYDSLIRAQKFLEGKKYGADGKITILPHEIAQIMGYEEISQLIIEKMKQPIAPEVSNSSYSFYSHKNSNNNSKINDPDKALPSDTCDIEDQAPEVDTSDLNNTISQ